MSKQANSKIQSIPNQSSDTQIEIDNKLRYIAGYIDHSILKPTTTEKELYDAIQVGKEKEVAAICVMPSAVTFCASEINKHKYVFHKPRVCTVIGFPNGYSTTKSKIYEAMDAIENGASEIDMVININSALCGHWVGIGNEIDSIYSAVKEKKALLKVIFETCYLTDRQIVNLCEVCNEVMDAGFVKTSTGFGSAGATVKHVELMSKTVNPSIGIKASGGIKTFDMLAKLINAGATRIGCSVTSDIIKEAKQYYDAGLEPPF